MQQKIYIKKMTSWTNEAASLSGGKRAPHALERGGPSLWTGTKAIAYLGGGRKSRGLASQCVCIILSTLQVFFMALAKAFKAAEVLRY